MEEKAREKRLFITYEVALLLKGIQASLEILGGLVLCFVSTREITATILLIAHGELAESPDNVLSAFLIRSADQLSASGKLFVVLYLLLHGIIKLVVIIGLFQKKSWAYPAALVGLGGLIAYQLYSLLSHYSVVLVALTAVDSLILWLVVREHRVSIKML